MTNVIVHHDVYERDRLAIRGGPFLWVKGKLAKDVGTVNVIAEEVRSLGARRSGGPTDRRTETASQFEPPSDGPPVGRVPPRGRAGFEGLGLRTSNAEIGGPYDT